MCTMLMSWKLAEGGNLTLYRAPPRWLFPRSSLWGGVAGTGASSPTYGFRRSKLTVSVLGPIWRVAVFLSAGALGMVPRRAGPGLVCVCPPGGRPTPLQEAAIFRLLAPGAGVALRSSSPWSGGLRSDLLLLEGPGVVLEDREVGRTLSQWRRRCSPLSGRSVVPGTPRVGPRANPWWSGPWGRPWWSSGFAQPSRSQLDGMQWW